MWLFTDPELFVVEWYNAEAYFSRQHWLHWFDPVVRASELSGRRDHVKVSR
jgi:hypothetical protein